MHDIDKVVFKNTHAHHPQPMSFISFRKGLGSGTVNTSAYTMQMQRGELGSSFTTTSVIFIYTGKMYQC